MWGVTEHVPERKKHIDQAIDIPAADGPLAARDQARCCTLRSGKIELKNQVSTIDVIIRDMSLSGALPTLEAICTQRHSCLKVWQQDAMVGVLFLVWPLSDWWTLQLAPNKEKPAGSLRRVF